jgi:spoIIIJ-associated protein
MPGGQAPGGSEEALPEDPAGRVEALLGAVVKELGLRASVGIEEDEEEIRATVEGEDLGLLIGKHGSTIDALQHLASRAAFRGEEDRRRVVVDAAGYRDRREAALQRAAERAVSEALDFGRAVELEPMRPAERKVVHLYLRERSEVETHSEGDEPERRLVVTPVRPPPG